MQRVEDFKYEDKSNSLDYSGATRTIPTKSSALRPSYQLNLLEEEESTSGSDIGSVPEKKKPRNPPQKLVEKRSTLGKDLVSKEELSKKIHEETFQSTTSRISSDSDPDSNPELPTKKRSLSDSMPVEKEVKTHNEKSNSPPHREKNSWVINVAQNRPKKKKNKFKRLIARAMGPKSRESDSEKEKTSDEELVKKKKEIEALRS